MLISPISHSPCVLSVTYTFIQIGWNFHPNTLSSKYTFIQVHFHPKTVSSHPKTVPCKRHIHPKTVSSKNGFPQHSFKSARPLPDGLLPNPVSQTSLGTPLQTLPQSDLPPSRTAQNFGLFSSRPSFSSFVFLRGVLVELCWLLRGHFVSPGLGGFGLRAGPPGLTQNDPGGFLCTGRRPDLIQDAFCL